MRVCKKCVRLLENSEFKKNTSYKSGFSSSCKDCCRAYVEKHRERDAPKLKEYRRKYYLQRRGTILEIMRARTADERRPSRARYYAKHREKIVAKSIDTVHARRAQRKDGSFSREEWHAKLAEYEHRCAYCMVSAKLSRDHVVPLSRGGEHSARNIVPCCKRCNSSKNNKLISEWIW